MSKEISRSENSKYSINMHQSELKVCAFREGINCTDQKRLLIGP